MRVIITGGTGLIGTALSKSLLADGHEVIALSRNPATRDGLPPEVQVVGWDARTAKGWGQMVDGAGAIVNLAGANLAGQGFLPSRWTRERKRIIRDSRVYSSQAVVEAVEEARVKPGVLIQASGVGYYGHRGDQVVTEDTQPGDDYLARLSAEEWEPSSEPVERMGVRRVIARSGAVFSAEEGALPRMALPFRLFAGGRLGNG
ncbi:MAG: NAD(P)H-binding protein, partial [Anaerolineae bacterium]|nr:NAD(P)H-binding protein [Anaerolineae bacterium]